MSGADDPCTVLDGDGEEVAALCVEDGDDEEEVEANARLIAAAPDLAEACEELLAWAGMIRSVRDAGGPTEAVELARAALAKARGGP